eukprot:10808939-Lingulodinium_polyedra.AAC.1
MEWETEGPLPWIDETQGPAAVALRLVDGEPVAASACMADDSGFVRFEWPDKYSWLSEVPALGHPGVMKKPAKHPQAKTTKSSSEKKLVHSRAYHKAKAIYMKQCHDEDKTFDADACKAFARAQAQAAVQALA